MSTFKADCHICFARPGVPCSGHRRMSKAAILAAEKPDPLTTPYDRSKEYRILLLDWSPRLSEASYNLLGVAIDNGWTCDGMRAGDDDPVAAVFLSRPR